MYADLALVNGNILTMNSSHPSAEAIAIKKDRIVSVGTTHEINSWIGNDTRVINLGGRTVIPGLVDTHIHVIDYGKFLAWIDLKEVSSIKEMQSKIRNRVQNVPKGRWIIGNGWDQDRFVEKRYPNLHDLDEVSPENPVVLYHQCGRVCVVNSKALEFAKVTNKTAAPKDGKIEKDRKTGELTGILEDAATDLVWKEIPQPSEENLTESTLLACKKIVESGVTSVHWIVSSITEISIIRKIAAENELPLRIYILIPVKTLDQLNSFDLFLDLKDNTTKILGVKIFVDGSLAARTAALIEPYNDYSDTKGQLLYSQKGLNELVARVHKSKLRVVMHAMGDQAIEMALTAIEQTVEKNPKISHRYRLEHAAVLNEESIRRIRKLKVIVSVQPKCVVTEFLVWSAVDRLGSERAKWLYPLKTLIKKGIRVIGGSDCPMEPLNPMQGIQAAVTRPIFAKEQITVEEALKMYTVNAAYASFEESIKGTIEKGKLADITVLSENPKKVPTSKIGEIKVNMTIVGGKVAYQEDG